MDALVIGRGLAKEVASFVGGGDSAAAAEQAGVPERTTDVSTGDGVSLEFPGGRVLPGVAILQER
jgi:phosphoglycerate kinase